MATATVPIYYLGEPLYTYYIHIYFLKPVWIYLLYFRTINQKFSTSRDIPEISTPRDRDMSRISTSRSRSHLAHPYLVREGYVLGDVPRDVELPRPQGCTIEHPREYHFSWCARGFHPEFNINNDYPVRIIIIKTEIHITPSYLHTNQSFSG